MCECPCMLCTHVLFFTFDSQPLIGTRIYVGLYKSLIGPHKKGLHKIRQIIYYVIDLTNVTLLDYGCVVTWRHLVLDSEGQSGIRPPTKR